MTKKAPVAQVQAEGQSAEPYWQRFPAMESLLGTERAAVLRDIEATCRKLDVIRQSGTRQESVRAEAAMKGYARTLELYRQLAALRDGANQSGAGK